MRFLKVLLFRTLVIGCLNFLFIGSTYGQSIIPIDDIDSNTTMQVVLSLACAVTVMLLVVTTYIYKIVKFLLLDSMEATAKEQGEVYVKPPSIWVRLNQRLTNAVPIEEEEAIILDHEYDGIKELDNHLPPWWTYLFYATAVFAVAYMFVYHVFNSMPLQTVEYNREIALAAEIKAQKTTETKSDIDETNVVFSEDQIDHQKGQKIFQQQCAACHKDQAQGGIGPNLTDDYWLHGGSFKEVFTTIKYGVPEKGMISWEPLLSPVQMRNVASYIRTLKGSNPPNAKAPQGELYEEVVEASSSESDTTVVE